MRGEVRFHLVTIWEGKMRCFESHIEYPLVRVSEGWISKANHFLDGVDFCKQGFVFQFQLQKQGRKNK